MEKFYKSLLCFSLLSSGLIFADSSSSHPVAKNRQYANSWMLPNCDQGENQATISAQHREGNGIGYNKGYSSLNAFWNLCSQSEYHPFIDLRGHSPMTAYGQPMQALACVNYFQG